MRRLARARSVAGLAGWVAAGLVGTLFLAVAGSLLLGQRAVVVLSGSMEPAFSPGDVLVERAVDPGEVKVGQIVTFREPGTDVTLTHRVRRIEARGGRIVFTTKGDADNSVQRWAIDRGGQLQEPAWTIPKVGYVVMFAKTPLGLVAIVLLPLLALATAEIVRIWRPREPAGGLAEVGRRGRS